MGRARISSDSDDEKHRDSGVCTHDEDEDKGKNKKKLDNRWETKLRSVLEVPRTEDSGSGSWYTQVVSTSYLSPFLQPKARASEAQILLERER